MRRSGLIVGLLLCLVAPASALGAPPKPFGHDCTSQNGVRFCPTADDSQRVRSFDGIPLDVDVTLPPEGDGPFPTIVMLHGYGGNKSDFEQTSSEGDPATSETLYHYNNVHFAARGYAVVTYSARGFGRSCGQQRNAPSVECGRGYIHLADSRFEARDTQTLLGLLVDQGVTEAGAIGVTGISYGGGQSMQLAFLRDRVRMPDGSFSPWTSPDGTPLSITAAYPKWPWSDLVYSLEPNGRFLDYQRASARQSRSPLGVTLSSYVAGLYALGKARGYYCGDAVGSIPCDDPPADITTQFARTLQGEPEDAAARAIADEVYGFHSAQGIPGRPSPLLLQSGWTDDLFPVSESLRVYNRARAGNPAAPVSLQFGDLGHSRGSNKAGADRAFNDQGTAFFDAHLKSQGRPPAPGSVRAFTQTCPKSAAAGGPFTAASWARVHPGAVRFSSAAPQLFNSQGGNPQTARMFDPVGGTDDACLTRSDETAPGTAVYRLPASTGFTLLGRPTVTARVRASGEFGQIASRLWDVAPDGDQTLVTRGVYRLTPDQAGLITFQLHGNGYRFASRHVPKLELLGRDNAAPAGAAMIGSGYLRPSNAPFSVELSDLTLELPTAESPDGGQIVAPRFVRDPARAARVRRPLIMLRASPRAVRAGERRRITFTTLAQPRPCIGPAACAAAVLRYRLRGALVRFAGSSGRTDRRGRVSFVKRLTSPGEHVALATKRGFVPRRAKVRVFRGKRPGRARSTGCTARGGAQYGAQRGSSLQRLRCQRANR